MVVFKFLSHCNFLFSKTSFFLSFFAQTGKLSLQKMVYLLQPSKVTLRLLEKLCLRLKNIVGGQMVDVLHAVMLEQGDVKSRELHLHLLMCAAEPFVDTLATWIFR